MSDLDAAALELAGVLLAFSLIAFTVWWVRRPRPEPAAPGVSNSPRESRFPIVSRRADPQPEPVEISASRLARISRKPSDAPAAIDKSEQAGATMRLSVVDPIDADGDIEEALGAMATRAERAAHIDRAPTSPAALAAVRLVPRIPPRDAILARHWVGGRPRLPAGMAWPQIDGIDADFLAQVACADLPPGLWDGLGPRWGWIAFFSHPDSAVVSACHLPEDGPPRDPSRAVGPVWFRPYRAAQIADLTNLCGRTFPELAVDVVVADADDDLAVMATDDFAAQDYDIADPAFHPFDWASMAAMADVLESRLARPSAFPVPPADANDELVQALAEAVEVNREAAARARDIIAIIRETAGEGDFVPADATMVMAALHAIRWMHVLTPTDLESGEDRVEILVLPLTRHHPGADLWAEDYRIILFDRAKHAWSRHPDRLPAPMRACFEPLWQAMAARETATMGGRPTYYVHGFDDERDVVMLELPTSGLASRHAGEAGHLVLTMRKADLAAGDFAKLTARIGNP